MNSSTIFYNEGMNRNWKDIILAEISEELAKLEVEGREAKDVAELEALTIAMSQEVGRRTWEEWMKAGAKEAHFSP